MTSHKFRLQQDVINILGRQIQPVGLEELVHQVINEGFKSQRVYAPSEIRDTLSVLVDTGFVDKQDGLYQWRE